MLIGFILINLYKKKIKYIFAYQKRIQNVMTTWKEITISKNDMFDTLALNIRRLGARVSCTLKVETYQCQRDGHFLNNISLM